MTDLRCPRCADQALDAVPDVDGHLRFECPTCAGIGLEAADVRRLFGDALGPPAEDGLPDPFGDATSGTPCPFCGAPLSQAAVGPLDRGIARCAGCGGGWFDASAFLAARRHARDELDASRITTDGLELELDAVRPVARASVAVRRLVDDAAATAPVHSLPPRPPSVPALTSAERAALTETSPDLAGARFSHADPWSRLLAFPLVFVLASGLATTDLGAVLAAPVRIQFHELGHALVAWMGGRLAIPLPCGLTWVGDESHLGVHLMVLCATFALGYRGFVERRPFAVVLAVCLEAMHLACAAVSPSRFEVWLLWNGGAGELWLAGLACAAFYFPMPDRLRWDFFRFLVLPFAAAAYTGAMGLWIRVRTGAADAPVGSLFGTVGDGTGDLERLVADHGRDLHAISESYLSLGLAVGAAVVALYAVFAVRAVRSLLAARGFTGR